jgi:hypothetical protein
LVQAAARRSGRQLAALLGCGLTGLVLAIWLFAPWVERNFPALWYEVPAFMLAGPAAYAATRRVGPAFVAQVVITLATFITSWARFGTWTNEPRGFLLGVILSAVLYEISFYLLSHQTTWGQTPDRWQREVAWYAVTAIIATFCFYLPWYPPRFQSGAAGDGAAAMGSFLPHTLSGRHREEQAGRASRKREASGDEPCPNCSLSWQSCWLLSSCCWWSFSCSLCATTGVTAR